MNNAQIDWITIAEDLIDSLNSQSYRKLLEDPLMIQRVKDLYKKYGSRDFVKVSFKDVEEIEQLAGIFTNRNMFNIESYNDLVDLNREKQYHDMLIGSKTNPYLSKLTNPIKPVNSNISLNSCLNSFLNVLSTPGAI